MQKRKELLGLHKTTPNGKRAYSKEKWFYLVETPFLISDYCCDVMKKSPMKIYERATGKHPMLGTLAEESSLRTHAWLEHGCNAFDGKRARSTPIAFWTEQDVLLYIKEKNLPICPVYGDVVTDKQNKLCTSGAHRTGCEFCAFGLQNEVGETRFQRLKKTHPKQYDYCFGGGQWIPNPEYDPKYTDEPDEIGWVEWNPEKIWVPSKEGLGMAFVFDKVNELYGKYFYRY